MPLSSKLRSRSVDSPRMASLPCPMKTLHTIEADHISRLAPGQLVTLLRTLLYCEARPGGQAVHVPQQISVPDDGEDGSWDGEVKANENIPETFTVYQSKAEELEPADCAAAMLASDGTIKPAVAKVLRRKGAYVFFCGRPYVQMARGIERRVAAAVDALKKAGAVLRRTRPIHFLDANKIAAWTNRHAAAVAHVAMCCQLPPVGVLRTWTDWGRDGVCSTTFYSNARLDTEIVSLRDHLAKPGAIARVTGYSGLGKTRLAFEALRPPSGGTDIGQAILSHAVGYLDMEHSPEHVLAVVSTIEASGMTGLLVIDNCSKGDHTKLLEIVQRLNSRLSLLTLDYEPEYPLPGVVYIQLEPEMLMDVVPRMLKDLPAARRLNEAQLNHIAAFAGGFPQIAALMAEAGDTLDLAGLDQKGLAHRILWGRATSNEAARKAICALSLFAHVGFDGEARAQKAFVREQLCGPPVPSERDFDTLLRPFVERRLVQKAGDYRLVAPTPLAVALAAHWWELATADELASLLPLIEKAGMTEAFCRRAGQLHFSPTASALVEQLLGPTGPLSDAGVLSSGPGSQLFRAFVELNPDAACDCLWRVFGDANLELLRRVREGRRNLVWALEKICWRRSEFLRGAEIMLRFAAAENENYTNNATGQFRHLFQLFLSGTQMPAIERLAVLEKGLASQNTDMRRICVEALGVGLNARHFGRTGGVEVRGSGLPEEDWSPRYNRDIGDYWLRCFEMLVSVALERSTESERAKAEMGRRLRGILLAPLVEKFEPGFRRVAEASGNFWPEALASIRTLMEFEGVAYPEPVRMRLGQWIEWLTPRDLAHRLVMTVTAAPFELTKTEDGRLIGLADAKAEALADEMATQLPELRPHLEALQTGDQRAAYAFGRRLAAKVQDPAALVEESLAALGRVAPEKRNPSLLGGMLAGAPDPGLRVRILDRVAANSELVDQIAALTHLTPIDGLALERIIILMSEGKIPTAQLRLFGYGSVTDTLTPEAVLPLFQRLVAANPEARPDVFDVLSMFVHHSPERWQACRAFLRELMMSANFSLGLNGVMDLHHWEQAAQKLLKGQRDEALARELTQQIIAAQKVESLRFNGESVRRALLGELLSAYADTCWPVVAAEILSKDYYRFDVLLGGFGFDDNESSILWNVPPEKLAEWVQSNLSALPRILKMMPLFCSDGKAYHWHPSTLALLAGGVTDEAKRSVAMNLFSYGSTGSCVPYIERRIHLLHTLDDHPQASVREMGLELIAAFETDKAREQKSDEEEAAGIY